MIANYHTHTFRCHHAAGTESEYIETAIKAGYEELGFSDHSPQPFPNDHKSGWRMDMEDAPEYFQTLKELREEYKKDIKIHIGLECEYYPELFGIFLEKIKPLGLDFLIMGQHAIYNEYDINYPLMMSNSDNVEHLVQYVNQTCEGLKTGKFTYMAHPDGYKFNLPDDVYGAEMIKICQTAKDLNIPLEINLLGLRDGRHYPSDRFFRLASKVGNDVILGCDAHEPESVFLPENIKAGEEFAQKYGLNLLNKIKLITP